MTDHAAGIRGTIAKLSQLNDDGTPAAPAQPDGPAVSAEPGITSGGLDLDVLLGIDRTDPEQMAAIRQVALATAWDEGWDAAIAMVADAECADYSGSSREPNPYRRTSINPDLIGPASYGGPGG